MGSLGNYPGKWATWTLHVEFFPHVALYMELPLCVMQRVVFCLCESCGNFSMEFAKCCLLVYDYVVCK